MKDVKKEAARRFDSFYNLEREEAIKRGNFNSARAISKMTLILSPFLLQKPLCPPDKLPEILNDIYIEDYFDAGKKFPVTQSEDNTIELNKNNSVELDPDGISLGCFNNNFAYYVELNCLGVYYYGQHLFGKIEELDKEPERVIRFSEIIARIDELLQSADKYYSALGFNGLLSFSFAIEGLQKFKLNIGNESCEAGAGADSIYYENSFMTNQIMFSKKILYTAQ